MEKQKKSVGTIALVVLLLVVTVVSLILATYAWAKYTTTITPENPTTANIAKWNVNASQTANGFEFSKTYSHVISPNELAPGTQGSIETGIDVTDTEVDVLYQIGITGVTNKPSNLMFFATQAEADAAMAGTAATRSTAIDVSSASAQNPANVYDSSDTVHHATVGGSYYEISVGDANKVANHKIYWAWPYETKDASGNTSASEDGEDTIDGETKESMSVTYRILAWQEQPAANN